MNEKHSEHKPPWKTENIKVSLSKEQEIVENAQKLIFDLSEKLRALEIKEMSFSFKFQNSSFNYNIDPRGRSMFGPI